MSTHVPMSNIGVEGRQEPREIFLGSEAVLIGFERGAMVRVQGLKSKPELNDKIAVVTGPPAENGRIPCTIAPVLPTEELARISAKEDNLELLPHPPDIMATAWNNVALALKRSDALVEANGAFVTAHEYAPSGSPIQLNILANWIKLCSAMRSAGLAADESALESKVSSLMGQLFQRVTSRPELRGLDAVYAVDFVPGYSQRQLMCGIANSVDAQPARQHGKKMACSGLPSGPKRRALAAWVSKRGCGSVPVLPKVAEIAAVEPPGAKQVGAPVCLRSGPGQAGRGECQNRSAPFDERCRAAGTARQRLQILARRP